MARNTIVQVVSDISGKPLEEGEARNVILGFEDRMIELDLSQEELDKLTKVLNPYLEAGTPVNLHGEKKQKRPDTGSGLPKEDMKAVRQWWKHSGTVEGFEPKDRGRIPKQVIDSWLEKGKPAF